MSVNTKSLKNVMAGGAVLAALILASLSPERQIDMTRASATSGRGFTTSAGLELTTLLLLGAGLVGLGAGQGRRPKTGR